MALTGLQIFKLMPKTNCKDCGHPTCLAFSMALASSKAKLDDCPHVSDDAKEQLGAAAAPPVAKITFGAGDKAREMGDETVLFRHDKRFFHPTCIAVSINDDMDENAFHAKLEEINSLCFERVGEKVSIDAIALIDKSGNADNFAAKAGVIAEKGLFAPVLVSGSADALGKAASAIKAGKPLLCGTNADNWEQAAKAAKDNDCPITVSGKTLDEIAALSEKVAGITKDIVLNVTAESEVERLAILTQIRRQAIRKKVRPLGYPSCISVAGKESYSQVAEASMYVAKYGSLIIMDTTDKADLLPLCALRQNLFSDPQKPAQVQPGIYPIGDADENSPVYCTTNFSLTYYTVEGELSSTKLPCWIIAAPTDGTSVLTAWAAGKFTADTISEYMKELELDSKFKHNNIVIPGYVASLKAPLEELSGWKVIIAPNEASGLPAFAKASFGG